MRLFIDSADVPEVINRCQTGLVSGVTTNPTLIRKSNRKPWDVYHKLIEYGVQDLSIEIVGQEERELFEHSISAAKEYGDKATIKLPCSAEGLRVCRRLADVNVRVNVTLVFSVSQAILASLAGAAYVSPFVGRLDDNSLDGIGLIERIAEVFTLNDSRTQILAASIRDVQSVERAFLAGADICTVPVDVFDKMHNHVLTDKGIAQFNKDAAEFLP